MPADNYPQSPSLPMEQGAAKRTDVEMPTAPIGVFPYPKSINRLNDYDYYSRLFLGHHFEAFRIRVDDEKYNRAYAKLRYVMVNFAGLVSKIVADMLFSEPPTIKVPGGDQAFVDALWTGNQMDIQCYESALSNSYNGDAVFKIRAGKIRPNDAKSAPIIEDIMPKLYFPKVDGFNVRAEPATKELAWTFAIGDTEYLRKEIHYAGKIENKVYEMKGNEIVKEVGLDVLGIPNLPVEQSTGIDRSLIVHVVNWKTGDRHFGLSDYFDLDTIFYAINNRMSKIDNILDKHGDPILTVPPGVLDDKGQVKKKSLGVIEIGEGETGKPEYIVWDAKLESAFSEVEKLVDFMYLIGEISPDILGLGEGKSESGRALKFKLMRTIAKVARKRLYYDRAIKEVIYVAQLMAKAHGLEIDGVGLKGEPVMPEIEWNDGLPIDNHEAQEDEIAAIDAGIQSKKEAIMALEGVDEATAEKKLKEIEDEQPKIEMPPSNISGMKPNPKDKKAGGKPPVKVA